MILLLIRKVRYKSLVSWLGDVVSVVLTLEIIASKRLFCRGGGTGPAGPVLAAPSVSSAGVAEPVRLFRFWPHHFSQQNNEIHYS